MEAKQERITVIQRPAQPPCTCKECKAGEALIMELESGADDLLAMVHARIQRYAEEEEAGKSGKQARTNLYLQARGEMDS